MKDKFSPKNCAALYASILFLIIAADGKAEGLERQVASLLPPNSVWALHILDLKDEKGFESSGGSNPLSLVPGSCAKVLVSGAVIQYATRNGGFDVEAVLRHDGDIAGKTLKGSLYLAGSGNALLSAADFRTAAGRIAKGGTSRVVGDLVVDDMLFHTADLERSRTGAGHAPAGALGLDLHTVAVLVTPAEPGQAPEVAIEPPNAAARFAVAARTVAGGIASLRIDRLDDLSYRITGNVPRGSGTVKKRFPLSDPALFAGGVLKTLLEEAGIRVDGVVKKGKTPDGTKQLAGIPGLPLDEMLRDMNVHSLNVMADNLLLALGAKRFGSPGTRQKGVGAVEEFLASLDLPMDEVEIYDGSGLSDKNRMTAGFMARYLCQASKQNWFERFKNTLPRPGHEGTAGEIGFKDERFRVKTGRLEDVYALAGYGVDGARRDVAFCFVVNGPGVGILPNMDDVGAEVLRFIAAETFHR